MFHFITQVNTENFHPTKNCSSPCRRIVHVRLEIITSRT